MKQMSSQMLWGSLAMDKCARFDVILGFDSKKLDVASHSIIRWN